MAVRIARLAILDRPKLKSGRPGRDISGIRFGRLVVVRYLGRTQNGVNTPRVWLCKCDCGNEKDVMQHHLTCGDVVSCGCLQREKSSNKLKHRILPVGKAFMNSLFRRYRQQARERCREFTLTREQFEVEIAKPCSYCGVEPTIPHWALRAIGPKGYPTWNGVPKCNGLDRKDSNKGYAPGNVTACCVTCNIAKHTMTHEEFISWARRVVEHHGIMSTRRVALNERS
jgi:hypothetical protein